MIATNENVYDNIKLNETRNILQDTIEEYEKEYGFNLYREVKVRCVAKFYDGIINESKNVFVDHCNINGELNKIMQKSRGKIKLIKIIEVKIFIKGRIHKNTKDMYFKSWCMPILWKKNYARRRCLGSRNEKHYCHFKIIDLSTQ